MRSLEIIIEKVLIHGKSYRPALVPNLLPRGKIGDCFDHTLKVAMKFPKYRYVEGIAKRPSNGEWVLHSWLTDGIHAFDLTWGIYFGKSVQEAKIILPLQTEYIGIEMDTEKVINFYLSTQYKSVLQNGWRDEKLSEEILKFNF